MDETCHTMADRHEHSAGDLHPVQHLHIPRTHISSTQTRADQRTRGSIEPIRSVEPERSGSGDAHPTAMPIGAYGLICVIKANNFGNKILRMAGIVQMLHAHNSRYDKYSYNHANRKRTVTVQRSGPRCVKVQERRRATVSLAVPGPCATVLAMCHHPFSHTVCSSPIWLILHILLTLSVPSIRAYKSDSIEDSINSQA